MYLQPHMLEVAAVGMLDRVALDPAICMRAKGNGKAVRPITMHALQYRAAQIPLTKKEIPQMGS